MTLAHHKERQVQARELDLLGMVYAKLAQEPVVQGAVVFELEAAERVRDALESVGEAVREVVHRVDAPIVSSSVVGSF